MKFYCALLAMVALTIDSAEAIKMKTAVSHKQADHEMSMTAEIEEMEKRVEDDCEKAVKDLEHEVEKEMEKLDLAQVQWGSDEYYYEETAAGTAGWPADETAGMHTDSTKEDQRNADGTATDSTMDEPPKEDEEWTWTEEDDHWYTDSPTGGMYYEEDATMMYQDYWYEDSTTGGDWYGDDQYYYEPMYNSTNSTNATKEDDSAMEKEPNTWEDDSTWEQDEPNTWEDDSTWEQDEPKTWEEEDNTWDEEWNEDESNTWEDDSTWEKEPNTWEEDGSAEEDWQEPMTWEEDSTKEEPST